MTLNSEEDRGKTGTEISTSDCKCPSWFLEEQGQCGTGYGD